MNERMLESVFVDVPFDKPHGSCEGGERSCAESGFCQFAEILRNEAGYD